MAPKRFERELLGAETFTPAPLHRFLADLERTTSSGDVWKRLVALGQEVDLPSIDFIAASCYADWRRTLFIRTSYDSSFLHTASSDPEISKWSYFRSHAIERLTPILIGIEFAEDYHPQPEGRLKLLRLAAEQGLRAGFSVPLRIHVPPQAAMITFSGDHSRERMLEILSEHGWTLNVAAMAAHQRYMFHFATEFFDRNEITPKQRALLELVGQGLQDKQIAERLGISISALRQRMNGLMSKAQLANRAEIAALAMSVGLLPDPELWQENLSVLVEMDDAGVRVRSHKK
ncbi:helix-turn-helix transcriptional regulator [Thalassovita sp.]|uniref:helix-turn-helix transcriptional regulator n=1 Tax=Thalassovita sp. TaxID=1979401 RepID=UPI0029DE6D3F|nr:LuxR C-terminal-related transcriptional regulator [Thalassovita sp.]